MQLNLTRSIGTYIELAMDSHDLCVVCSHKAKLNFLEALMPFSRSYFLHNMSYSLNMAGFRAQIALYWVVIVREVYCSVLILHYAVKPSFFPITHFRQSTSNTRDLQDA